LENRIKDLKSQLHELNGVIHGTVYEINRLEKEIIPIELGLNKLNENKSLLKSEGIIVVISVYQQLKKELYLTESRFKKISGLLDKYKNYLDSLLEKENTILNEIDQINEMLDKERKVLSFDLNRKKDGKK